nr:MAG TPA: hypothetical protein [Caudoviricetes sp.]
MQADRQPSYLNTLRAMNQYLRQVRLHVTSHALCKYKKSDAFRVTFIC